MTNAEAIKAFTDLLKAGEHEEAARRFHAPEIVSVEPHGGPMARAEGADAVKAKAAWFYGAHEVHGGAADGPYMNGDQFAVIFDLDFTARATGERTRAKEVALYTMRDGRIVEERFFY